MHVPKRSEKLDNKHADMGAILRHHKARSLAKHDCSWGRGVMAQMVWFSLSLLTSRGETVIIRCH